MKANLILNGDLDYLWILKKLKDKPKIYCTDGAYDKIMEILPLNIEAVIGDMDSITVKPKPKMIHMPDQNYTDFEKALQYLEKFQSIDIYGASGKEMDHFLGNLNAAKKYKDKIQLKFREPGYYYHFLEKDTVIKTKPGKTISILPFPKAESVTTEGLEYELKKDTLETGKLISIRNKAIKNNIKIQYKKGCAIVFVYT